MTVLDASLIAMSFVVAGIFYAYLLNERRKLHARKRPKPTE
jgi:hypothetical protein